MTERTNPLPDLSPNSLRRLSDAWTAAGLDADIGAWFADAHTRLAELQAERRAYRDTPAARQIGAAIANGDTTLADSVIAKVARGHDSIAQDHYRWACDAVLRQLTARLRDLGDSIIRDHLATREAAIFAEAHKAAEKLDGITSPEEAFARGGAATTAWHTVSAARDAVDAITDAHRYLAAPVLKGRLGYPDDTALPPGNLRHHPVRRFADLVLHAGPRRYLEPDAPAPKPAPRGVRWENRDGDHVPVGVTGGDAA